MKTNENTEAIRPGALFSQSIQNNHNAHVQYAEISIGDTIEYRVDNIDRSRRRFHQPAFRPDTIDSINGVAVKHEE